MYFFSVRKFILITIAIYFVWVALPPFPNPKSIVGRSQSDVRGRLGNPDTEFPDKFNHWRKNRGLFVWVFETDSPAPPNLSDPVQRVALRLLLVSPVASIPIYTDEVRIREP